MSPIHDEVTFDFPAARIYRALMDPGEHAEITGFPTEISPEEGGKFSLFAARITGRNLELAPNRRIVQAWRGTHWPEGVYSVVRLELEAEGDKTRLILDHAGVPENRREAIVHHWKYRYWEPLRQHLEEFPP